MKRALAAAGALAVAHAAPAVTAIPPLRPRLRSLAGVGTPGHVALTFDDGPDRASTPEFLTLLERRGVRATFFMLGELVREDPGLAKEVVAAGHEVAVHGDDHRNHLWCSPQRIIDGVQRAADTIADVTGQRPRWFRPPYGMMTTAGMVAARRAQLRTILWTTWGWDWQAAATGPTVVDTVLRGLLPGSTVLLHDTSRTAQSPDAFRSTLAALPPLLDAFEARGLRVGPLAEHGLGPAD